MSKNFKQPRNTVEAAALVVGVAIAWKNDLRLRAPECFSPNFYTQELLDAIDKYEEIVRE